MDTITFIWLIVAMSVLSLIIFLCIAPAQRKTFAQFIGGIAIVGGILTTLYQMHLVQANYQKDAKDRTNQEYQRQYLDSVKLLGEPEIGPRIGAIYNLAPLMEVDERLHNAVLETLVGYIRSKQEINPNISKSEREETLHNGVLETLVGYIRSKQEINPNISKSEREEKPGKDIQTAIDVIGSRKKFIQTETKRLKLNWLYLADIDFTRGNENNKRMANFAEAEFDHSILTNTNFQGVLILGANFSSAILGYKTIAKPEEVNNFFDLPDYRQLQLQSDLSNSDARGAHFDGTDLAGAKFEGATLGSATFIKADLSWANFEGVTEELRPMANNDKPDKKPIADKKPITERLRDACRCGPMKPKDIEGFVVKLCNDCK